MESLIVIGVGICFKFLKINFDELLLIYSKLFGKNYNSVVEVFAYELKKYCNKLLS